MDFSIFNKGFDYEKYNEIESSLSYIKSALVKNAMAGATYLAYEKLGLQYEIFKAAKE